MKQTSRLDLLCFFLQNRLFAIPVRHVHKVIRAVEVTPVPKAGDAFYGVIDFHGEVLPVINMRHSFSMPPKPIGISDRFLIIRTDKRSFSLVTDEIEEIRTINEADIQQLDHTSLKKEATQAAGLRQCTFYSSDNAIIILYEIDKLLGSELILQIDALNDTLKETQPI